MPATMMSIAEFESLPEMPGKLELLQGEPIFLPPAGDSHNRITQVIFETLRPAFETFRVRMEAGYQLSTDTWLQPDVSITWPDQPVSNNRLQGSPMIAVEVLSPGNKAREVEKKVAAYLRYGAAEVRIVNSDTSSMIVHKPASIERITGTYQSEIVPVAIGVPDILAV